MAKITDIAPQQKSKLFSVFADGEFVFSADSGFIAKENVFVGKEYSAESLETLVKAAEGRKALRHALYLLEKRDFSRKGLADRLREKGYSKEHAEKAADDLVSMGYIDDARYAEKVVEKYKNRNGERYIFRELLKTGLAREDAENLITERYSSEDDSVPAVLRGIAKKFKNAEISDRNDINKIYTSFLSRGFSAETIRKAIEQYNENRDEQLD